MRTIPLAFCNILWSAPVILSIRAYAMCGRNRAVGTLLAVAILVRDFASAIFPPTSEPTNPKSSSVGALYSTALYFQHIISTSLVRRDIRNAETGTTKAPPFRALPNGCNLIFTSGNIWVETAIVTCFHTRK